MKYVPVDALEKYMAEVHLDRTYPSTGIQLRQLLASEALDAVPVAELETVSKQRDAAVAWAEATQEREKAVNAEAWEHIAGTHESANAAHEVVLQTLERQIAARLRYQQAMADDPS